MSFQQLKYQLYSQLQQLVSLAIAGQQLSALPMVWPSTGSFPTASWPIALSLASCSHLSGHQSFF